VQAEGLDSDFGLGGQGIQPWQFSSCEVAFIDDAMA